MKKCTLCNKLKSFESFNKDARLKSRLKSWCRSCTTKKHKKWYDENIELARKIGRDHYHANKEKIKEYTYNYRLNNKAYFRSKAMERHIAKSQSKPIWANDKYIKLWYSLARIEEERTGRKIHVDHIIPLNGESVCGLHCEQNMQLLFAEDNISKGNKYAD